MASFNKVIIMGNLTRDVEIKYLQSGAAVANFGMALNESYTDKKTGEQKESVCFVDIQAWERNAEIASEYLKKGSPVLIEGKLNFEQWETQDGTRRNKLSVRVMKLQLLGSRGDQQQQGSGNGGDRVEPTMANPAVPSGAGVPSNPNTEDDIPF